MKTRHARISLFAVVVALTALAATFGDLRRVTLHDIHLAPTSLLRPASLPHRG